MFQRVHSDVLYFTIKYIKWQLSSFCTKYFILICYYNISIEYLFIPKYPYNLLYILFYFIYVFIFIYFVKIENNISKQSLKKVPNKWLLVILIFFSWKYKRQWLYNLLLSLTTSLKRWQQHSQFSIINTISNNYI